MPVYNWSTTAATNANADSTINWAEGQAPSSVNDSARAMMAALKKFTNDAVAIVNATTGTSTAYTLTTNSVFDSLAHMDKQVLVIVPHTDNGASVTLAVDSLTAKPINRTNGVAVAAGELKASSPYALAYDNSNNQFLLLTQIGTELGALSTLASNGLIARTGSAAYSSRSLTAPAAGITIANPDGVTGNPTFALANDLAGLEGIGSTGVIPYRSAADTWGTVTVSTGLSFTTGTLSSTVTGGFATGKATLAAVNVTNAISSANSSTDVLTVTSHGMTSGQLVWNHAGNMPTGVTNGAVYYAGVIDANTFKVYTTLAGALAGDTSQVDITGTTTGATLRTATVVVSANAGLTSNPFQFTTAQTQVGGTVLLSVAQADTGWMPIVQFVASDTGAATSTNITALTTTSVTYAVGASLNWTSVNAGQNYYVHFFGIAG